MFSAEPNFQHPPSYPPLTAVPTAALRFVVRAAAQPGVLSRILGEFEKRALIPTGLSSRRAAGLEIEIETEALSDGAVDLLVARLAAMIDVDGVAVETPWDAIG